MQLLIGIKGEINVNSKKMDENSGKMNKLEKTRKGDKKEMFDIIRSQIQESNKIKEK